MIGIYCRVSGDSQKIISLKSQNLGVKFCNDRGYDYEIFSEVVIVKLRVMKERVFRVRE